MADRGSCRFLPLPLLLLASAALLSPVVDGCQFSPAGEYLRFVRLPENVPVGGEVLQVEVHPHTGLTLQPVDKAEDASFFKLKDLNSQAVSVVLAKSLENLVDGENPQNVLKFRLVCDFEDGEDTISSYLSVTVYVEDINDHSPEFVDAPYQVAVDELTPSGATIYRGIHAVDRDKPNTPNSDVQYVISGGNEKNLFALESRHRGALLLRHPLDYDAGDREFALTLTASDRGSPPRNSSTELVVVVLDSDDLNPKFTRDVYRTRITEFYPVTGRRIHQELSFSPPIEAYDQDLGVDAELRYDIVAGNERHLFSLDAASGSLFLERELDRDRDRERGLLVLQLQAAQVERPLRTAAARVEVELLDLNDNLPEFEVDAYNVSIVENLPNGFSVLQVRAHDRDQGDNAEFSYVLDDPSEAFIIDPRSGWLAVRNQGNLDREKQATLLMTVKAQEKTPSVVNATGCSSVAVEVNLLDANDNNPTFKPANLYEFTVPTSTPPGSVIGKVTAIDPDLGRNGFVLYDLQHPGNNSSPVPFTINSQTGEINVTDQPLLRGKYALFVEASDQPANPSERRFSLAVVSINVVTPNEEDSSEDIPDFIGAPYEFWVGASVGIGTSVGQIRTNDAVDKNSVTYDMLHSYHSGVPFAVEERSGVITVVDEIEKYDQTLFEFESLVTDAYDVTLVTNLTIHVVKLDSATVLDTRSMAEFRVRENQPPHLLGMLPMNRNDSRGGGLTRFTVANLPDIADLFSVSDQGALYTQQSLDREERHEYLLTVIAETVRGVAAIYQVSVLVEDENDNPPIFEKTVYEGHIEENSPSGTEVMLDSPLKATDVDTGANSVVSFTLYGDGSEMFSVDQVSGKVFFKDRGNKNSLDREEKAMYVLHVVARDGGNLTSEANLTIYIEDVNDNAPKFVQLLLLSNDGVHFSQKESRMHFTNSLSKAFNFSTTEPPPPVAIPESIASNIPILRLLANDKDNGSNATITYQIIADPGKMFFSIHSQSGEVSASRTLPPDTEFNMVVEARDSSGLTDTATFRIYVEDVNDHAPIFQKPWYSFELLEGNYSLHILGRVEASDADLDSNANISYSIVQDSSDTVSLPFSVTSQSGIVSVSGAVDRELVSSYSFRVRAQDGGGLHSSVPLEVHILDANDNSPVFYGYTSVSANGQPVYKADLSDASDPGFPVAKVFANDSDSAANGNGLILFSTEGPPGIFAIDSKSGIVTTTSHFDAFLHPQYVVTVVASDLGDPSRSSKALLEVNVQRGTSSLTPKGPAFPHRYYEMEVEENCAVPAYLLTLNVTVPYRGNPLNYSLVQSHDSSMFYVGPKNGSLYLVISPDREQQVRLEVRVKVELLKRSRSMANLIYPPSPEQLAGLASNEVRVILQIKDVNDNSPRFTVTGRPIVAAIPTSANYGFQIVKLQAVDKDEGVNAEIRYQILGRPDDESHRFSIDPISGQVRSIASFAKDTGRVYGFDVKATDRCGVDDGRSAIANVFVYVLDDDKQLVMVLGSKPTFVEKSMHNITTALYNATGLDVRIQKLEPHSTKNQEDLGNHATDLYLYAVDPQMNVIIDMETLQNVLNTKQLDIRRRLKRFQVVQVALPALGGGVHAQRKLLSSLEVGILILGILVFIGALAAALCIGCVRRKKFRKQALIKSFPSTTGFSIASPPRLSPYLGDTTDTYVDLHSGRSAVTTRRPERQSKHHHHRPGCTRRAGMEVSLASLQSCDSGLGNRGCCLCGHSTSHSSGDSSNGSFEDSLKRVQHRTSRRNSNVHPPSRRRQRQASTVNTMMSAHLPPPPSGAASPASSLTRRPSDRTVIQ